MYKPLPKAFEYLAAEPGPKLLVEALKWHGLHEVPGPQSSSEIMTWAAAVGARSYYPSDATAWCGLFLTYCAKQAGLTLPPDPLAALSWLRFGTLVPDNAPKLGDVLVYRRAGGGGHVTLYIGEDATHFFCLGGNQSDAVGIVSFLKSRPYTARRTAWRIAQPANVRRVFLTPSGIASRPPMPSSEA